MAKPEHEIPYTIGDQERQVRIEAHLTEQKTDLTEIKELLGNPQPRCAVNMEKITSLEKSRKRFQWASGSIGIGFVLYTMKQIFNSLMSTGG